MATIQVDCRFCSQSNAVRKHGKGVAGYQRFRCIDCQRTFQLDYAYEASKPGVRYTGRVLKVAYNTVLRILKTLT